MKADQIIGGTALNLFAPAFAIFAARTFQLNGVQQISFNNTFRISEVPVLGDIPIIGDMFFKSCYITTYLGIIILILATFVLYRTKFGLRLRSCGEHPQAADSVGINVYRMRYSGVMISGGLGGLGGLIFVIPTSTNFNADVAGYGFLALAVMICGQWKPVRIFIVSIFFGSMKALAAAYSAVPFLANAPITSDFYKMVPFIATLIIMAFTSKNSRAPKAIAQPYDKGSR
jgi:simple sugar transport system permease protein